MKGANAQGYIIHVWEMCTLPSAALNPMQVEAAAEAAKRWESAVPESLRVKFAAADGGTADILAISALSGLDEQRFMINPQQTDAVELVHMALAFMVGGRREAVGLVVNVVLVSTQGCCNGWVL